MSTSTSRSGAMLTAASEMISTSSWLGTSITKQWLTRRLVRNPPSRATTAPISSSVCRLPFIRHSAFPARTSATAAWAEAVLCAASTRSKPEMSSPACAATASMRAMGPTRIGVIRPALAASTAPRSDDSSHGCATAVTTAGSVFACASRRWYFSCLRLVFIQTP
jgi:hypothetical protein